MEIRRRARCDLRASRGRPRRRVLRLLCRAGGFETVQQVFEGGADPRRRSDGDHDGERLSGRRQAIRARRSGADIHRAQADRRRRHEDDRPYRRLFGAEARGVQRRGPLQSAARAGPDGDGGRGADADVRHGGSGRHNEASRSKPTTTSANTTSRSSRPRRATGSSTGSPRTATRFPPAPGLCSAATSSRTCTSSSPR